MDFNYDEAKVPADMIITLDKMATRFAVEAFGGEQSGMSMLVLAALINVHYNRMSKDEWVKYCSDMYEMGGAAFEELVAHGDIKRLDTTQ